MKKVQNSLNYQFSDHKGEINLLPSLTMPDQTMSIKQILEQFTRGVNPLTQVRVPVYENTTDPIPDIDKMDLADREQYIQSVKAEMTELNDQRKATLRSKQSALVPSADEKESQDAPPPSIS